MFKIAKNKYGFTVFEILTVTLIISALAVFAVPNYLRVKMNVDIELVKQNLRVIGEEMNEIYNRTRQFPEDILNLGEIPEETVITASLNSCDKKEWTDHTYTTSGNPPSSYFLKRCYNGVFKPFIGSPCLTLDPIQGVNQILPVPNAPDPSIIPVFVIPGDQTLPFLADASLSNQQKTEMLSAVFEYWASKVVLMGAEKTEIPPPTDGVYGGTATIPKDYIPAYESLLGGARDLIKKTMGWNLYDKPVDSLTVDLGFGSTKSLYTIPKTNLAGQELTARYVALEGFRPPQAGVPYVPTQREKDIKNAILQYVTTGVWTGKDSQGGALYKS